MILTGDYAATACAIALQASIADGEIIAMTGDGVNDAPSLKSAHIGIARGKRGTDVAREASAIVLLDDDFGSIFTAIVLGRRIYDNIRKAMAFIFAVYVPSAGFALLPLVLGLPILFGPIRIALLEMVIDPVCALVIVNRSFSTSLSQALGRGNKALRYVFPAVIAISALIAFVPQIQTLLRFGYLRPVDFGIAVAIGAALFVILEILKPFAKRAILDSPEQRPRMPAVAAA